MTRLTALLLLFELLSLLVKNITLRVVPHNQGINNFQ